MSKFDVYGIGNPLVDLLIKVDEKTITDLGLKKGHMTLVDDSKINEVLKKISKENIIKGMGDSTANTIAGIANLGGKCIYLGMIGNDEYGKFFEEGIRKDGVTPNLGKHSGMTGNVVCLITPDGERTFLVYLGACKELTKDKINISDLKESKILHLTGYQLEEPKLKETSLEAMRIAKEHGIKISLDLADPSLIERNKPFLKKIVKEYANIIFLNEAEAFAFTGLDPEEALNDLGNDVDTVCVKIGDKGSLITHEGAIIFIDAVDANVVDTTGAGDMYSACILYGLTNGLDIETSGKLASIASAKVVSQVGARLEIKIKDLPEVKALLG